MNEIDHVRALREDLPADPAGLARARNRLLDQAATAQPGRDRAGNGSAVHTPAVHTPAVHTPAVHTPAVHTPAVHTPAVHTPADHAPAGRVPAGHAPARYGRRLALAVAGAVAAAVAGTVALGGLPVLDGTPSGAQPAAAAVFREAADNAAKAQPVTARVDQYVYIRQSARQTTRVSYSAAKASPGTAAEPDRFVSYQDDYLYEQWRPVADGQPTLIRRTDGLRRQAIRPGDEAKLKQAGIDLDAPPTTFVWPDPSDPTDQPEPPLSDSDRANPFVNPTPGTLATLPTDPDRLLDRVRGQAGDAGPTPDVEALVVITDLFRQADALIGPDLRAALFRAAAKIPGMERVPGQVNLDGQVGIALGRVENGVREEIIVDPETSRVIGERSVVVGRAAPPTGGPALDTEDPLPVGTVLHWTATRSLIVDRSGQTTPARR